MTLSIRLAIRRVKAAENDVKKLVTVSVIPCAVLGLGSGLSFSTFALAGSMVATIGLFSLLINMYLIMQAEKRLKEAKKFLDELL